MITKKIVYTDLNGKKQTEEACFHLNKADLIKMQVSEKGGYENYLKGLIEAEDAKGIAAVFEDLIRKSYGKRSEDGTSFVKDPAATERFMQSEAYSELFVELLSDDEKSAEFALGIIPADLAKNPEIKKAVSKKK